MTSVLSPRVIVPLVATAVIAAGCASPEPPTPATETTSAASSAVAPSGPQAAALGTALDVTTQEQILGLMRERVEKQNLAVLYITHNLGVARAMTERIYVMYAGEVVEEAPTMELFRAPQHPYTQGLIKSVPRLDRAGRERLFSIKGQPPNLINLPDC